MGFAVVNPPCRWVMNAPNLLRCESTLLSSPPRRLDRIRRIGLIPLNSPIASRTRKKQHRRNHGGHEPDELLLHLGLLGSAGLPLSPSTDHGDEAADDYYTNGGKRSDIHQRQ